MYKAPILIHITLLEMDQSHKCCVPVWGENVKAMHPKTIFAPKILFQSGEMWSDTFHRCVLSVARVHKERKSS